MTKIQPVEYSKGKFNISDKQAKILPEDAASTPWTESGFSSEFFSLVSPLFVLIFSRRPSLHSKTVGL